MTKKDYIKFATALKDARENVNAWGPGLSPSDVFKFVEDELARVFIADNPKFDRERFLKAAGR